MSVLYDLTGVVLGTSMHAVPVPKLSPSASVTGGQVQIRWAGFAWHRESFPYTKMGRDDKHYKSASNTENDISG